MLIYAAAQSLFVKDIKSFWCIKLRGILLGLALIPLVFYLYNGIIGKSPDLINISIFFIAAAIAYRRLPPSLKMEKNSSSEISSPPRPSKTRDALWQNGHLKLQPPRNTVHAIFWEKPKASA